MTKRTCTNLAVALAIATLMGLSMLPLAAARGAQRKPMAEPEERAIAVIPRRGVTNTPDNPDVTTPQSYSDFLYENAYGPEHVFLDDAGVQHRTGIFSTTATGGTPESGFVQVQDANGELADGPIEGGPVPLPIRWPQGDAAETIRGMVPVLRGDYVDQFTYHFLDMARAPVELYAGTLNLNTTSLQSLITVPSGRILIVTEVIEDEASAAVTTAVGAYGYNGSANDVISNARLNSFTSTSQYIKLVPDVPAKVGAAAAVFAFKASVAEGSARTCKIRVVGFYK